MTYKEKHRRWAKLWADTHRKEKASYAVEYRRRLRRAIFLLLGDKCIRCGFSDERALQIDHIHNDGYKIRKQGGGCGTAFYRKILREASPERHYQILCANCNWIKLFESRMR